jgi:hypothetical protein
MNPNGQSKANGKKENQKNRFSHNGLQKMILYPYKKSRPFGRLLAIRTQKNYCCFVNVPLEPYRSPGEVQVNSMAVVETRTEPQSKPLWVRLAKLSRTGLYLPFSLMPALGTVKVQSEAVNTTVAGTFELLIPTLNWFVVHVPIKARLLACGDESQETMASEDARRRSAAITSKIDFFIKPPYK